MFYFDEDHMENGFEAPSVDDRFDCCPDEEDDEEDVVVGGGGGGSGGRSDQLDNFVRSSTAGDQHRAGPVNDSSTTIKANNNTGRMASPLLARRNPSYSDDDDDASFDEGEEEPTELVPLGMRSRNGTITGSSHRRRRGLRTCFYDFYKLTDDHLGAGAYASVRTGVAIATGKEVAVKLVDKHAGHTRSRIMREVDTFFLCKNHPNIVQLHEWFEDKDFFYMVFEKMRGGPLLNHIQRKVYFTEREACQVTRDIANALKYLHDHGIAHRDVKPENILCTDPERVSPVKLCDLDLASKASAPSPPLSKCLQPVHSEPNLASPVGSAEFMAPEVVDAFVGDALKYDKRCDMWSVGVILYIMLCGYPPFYGECTRDDCGWDRGETCPDCQENLFGRIQVGEFDFPEEEWHRVSDEAKDLISHLLVKNVRKRYTADDVLRHRWVQNGGAKTQLETPGILFRNDSTRDVHLMQEHFNVVHRLAAAGRLSSGGSEEELPPTISPSTLFKALEPLRSPPVTEEPIMVAGQNAEEELRDLDDTQQYFEMEDETNLEEQPTGAGMVMMPPLSHHPLLHVATTTATGLNPAMYGPSPYMHPQMYHHSQMMPFHPSQMINVPPGMMMMPPPAQLMPMPPAHLAHLNMMKNYPMVTNAGPMMPPMGTVYYAAPPPGAIGHYNPVTQQTVYYSGRYSAGDPLSAMPQPVYYHPMVPHQHLQQAVTMLPPQPPHMEQMQAIHRPPTPMTPPIGLETCQTAMARQDSKGDLRPLKRETPVHV